MSKQKVDSLTLKPSDCAKSIKAMLATRRSLFMWGPPGISKSETAQSVANEEGMAFIDLRLSQMDPTDLRGIPYPTQVGGVEGVRWSTPYVMPRNLNISMIVECEAEPTVVHFGNPRGSNNLHYVAKPQVTVRGIGAHAKIVTAPSAEFGLDKVVVALVDDNGNHVAGKVRVEVTGECRAILALEEFNSAPPSVQAAAYQLVLDRRLGEYEVPAKVFIMGMGNRDTDKGVTYKMPTPVMNRFVHLEMMVNFDDWQRWALLNGIHPEVVGYLSAFKEDLFKFDPGSAARGFPTPRSWVFVSDILTANDDLPDMVMLGLIAGAIGDGVGAKFMDFRKIAKDLPKADDVLSGKLKQIQKVEVALAYALTTTLCYELKERADRIKREGSKDPKEFAEQRKQWLANGDNFISFIMDNFQHEICVMGAKAAIAVHKLPFDPQKMKAFDDFVKKFRGLIMG